VSRASHTRVVPSAATSSARIGEGRGSPEAKRRNAQPAQTKSAKAARTVRTNGVLIDLKDSVAKGLRRRTRRFQDAFYGLQESIAPHRPSIVSNMGLLSCAGRPGEAAGTSFGQGWARPEKAATV